MAWFKDASGKPVWRDGNTIQPNPLKVREAEAEVTNKTLDAQGKRIENQTDIATQAAAIIRAEAEAESARKAAELTPGQKALDEAFAKEYADWINAGGFANAQNKLSIFDEQIRRLEGGDHITGPIAGKVPDWLSTIVNPDAVDVRENTERAIQETLRATLGSQFTKDEGERLMARTYNPSLEEATNAKRVRGTRDELSDKAWAKNDSARYFERHGTLKGHSPSVRPKTIGDALNVAEMRFDNYIKAKKLTPAQEQVARRRFYSDPRVKRLTQPAAETVVDSEVEGYLRQYGKRK